MGQRASLMTNSDPLHQHEHQTDDPEWNGYRPFLLEACLLFEPDTPTIITQSGPIIAGISCKSPTNEAEAPFRESRKGEGESLPLSSSSIGFRLGHLSLRVLPLNQSRQRCQEQSRPPLILRDLELPGCLLVNESVLCWALSGRKEREQHA